LHYCSRPFNIASEFERLRLDCECEMETALTSSSPSIRGKWTLESRDNVDAFLACRGVSWFVRTMILGLKADIEYLEGSQPNSIVKRTLSRMGAREETLPYPGHYEPARTLSGKPEVGDVFFETDQTVVQEMKWKDSGEVVARIERKVVGEKLNVTFKCEDIVATEVYAKIPG